MANKREPESLKTMFIDRYRLKLKVQQESGLLRNPPPIERRDGKFLYSKGTRLLNFASNDYLGLGSSKALGRKVAENFKRYGSSSSSSRLVAGNYTLLSEAEQAYADYFGYESALFFPSGYQANIGVLSTLFDPGDRVVFDKHVHASSVKGLSLSGAVTRGYNHSELSHLEKRLGDKAPPAGVVTESLFSMDGDGLDVAQLMALKQEYGFFCVVDEAHAFGALGEGGRGIARDVADVAVGTFGKALGLFGAFAFMPEAVKTYLLNFCSPQIYTTTLPEAHAASALDVLNLMANANDERRHLDALGHMLRAALRQEGFSVTGDAHIIAVHVGEEGVAVQLAQKLFDAGKFVLPARYPTVPLRKAILRVSLSAQHTGDDLDDFVQSLKVAHETH